MSRPLTGTKAFTKLFGETVVAVSLPETLPIHELDGPKPLPMSYITSDPQRPKKVTEAEIQSWFNCLDRRQSLAPLKVWWNEDLQKFVVFEGESCFQAARRAEVPQVLCIEIANPYHRSS